LRQFLFMRTGMNNIYHLVQIIFENN
jgi:hypothetical protein